VPTPNRMVVGNENVAAGTGISDLVGGWSGRCQMISK
jgi:hypothetical protein